MYDDSSESDTTETSIWSTDTSDESNGDDILCTSDSDTSIIDSDIGSKEDSNVDLAHKAQDGHMHLKNYKFNFAGFARYLEGIAGGNRNKDASKAIVRDVHLFFQATTATSSSDIDRLFNKSFYVDHGSV